MWKCGNENGLDVLSQINYIIKVNFTLTTLDMNSRKRKFCEWFMRYFCWPALPWALPKLLLRPALAPNASLCRARWCPEVCARSGAARVVPGRQAMKNAQGRVPSSAKPAQARGGDGHIFAAKWHVCTCARGCVQCVHEECVCTHVHV